MTPLVLEQMRRWRVPLLILLVICLLAVVALLGVGWYYANSLRNEALRPPGPDKRDLEVVAVEDSRVTLRPLAKKDGDWTKDGIFGLDFEGGYGQAGKIVSLNDHQVVREFAPIRGQPRVGDLARLDSFAWPGDPKQAFGIPFQEVTFASALGDLPAWLVGGPSDTWVIFVHGRGASRREALRMLPIVNDLGFASLVITYRNDKEAPASPDGFYRFGETEWEDLQAAAQYAFDHGARRLVLVGYSMGGAIVTNFLYESPLADRVVATVLDSPLLDFGAAVDWGARKRFAPWPIKPIGKAIAGFRFDIEWDKLNYLSHADELSVPILLFHGGADQTAPVETSDTLARMRPDIVKYVRVPDAGHVRSWNTNRQAYEAAVKEFLTGIVPSTRRMKIPFTARQPIEVVALEPIVEEQDLFGTAVYIAARIAAKAQGGQILVSDVVRQLVAGKGFLFADRGDVALRGFEDPVRLYEISWRGGL